MILSAQDTAEKPFVCFSPEQPEYPGGDAAMIMFIQKNLKYPDLARETGIQGKVIVGFVINKDGSISDVEVKKSVSKELDAEAVRVSKLLHFLPYRQQGDTFKSNFLLPIMFRLQDDNGLSPQQNAKIDQKAKEETDNINKVVPLGDVYQSILDVCKRDYTEIEFIKGGILMRDLNENQKRAMQALDKAHIANLKKAMGNDLYNKYEAAREAPNNYK